MSIEGPGGVDPAQQQYVQQAQQNIEKFEQNLNLYKSEKDEQMKVSQKEILSSAMNLIKQSIANISDSGIQNQGKALETDFNQYMQTGADTDLTKVTQDLATLSQALSEGA